MLTSRGLPLISLQQDLQQDAVDCATQVGVLKIQDNRETLIFAGLGGEGLFETQRARRCAATRDVAVRATRVV